MEQSGLSTKSKYHFIGIGGAGMSGIAKVLLEMGLRVSGSDLKESRYTKVLTALGAEISIGHGAANVDRADVVVTSSAVPEANVELKAAREQGKAILARAQMLARICALKADAIAVAGTHGKTTTTSMIASIFARAGVDSTFLIGGELNDIGSNASYGTGEVCVVEADESDGSLVHLKPKYAVVTNIDFDHMDYHKTWDALTALFEGWLAKLPADGKAVVLGDDSAALAAAKAAGCALVSYGRDSENDFYYTDAAFNDFGSEFTVRDDRAQKEWRLRLKVPGEHNILNALAAFAVSRLLDVDPAVAGRALAEFSGVKRRFQLVGVGREVAVVDDYAHHPTEVAATLKAAKTGDCKRVVCVFQPHRYSRTKLLSREFGAAFGDADITVMTDVYNAGETPTPGVSGKLLVDEILANRPYSRVAYIPDKLDIRDYLLSVVRPGDLVLTMGAGDVWTVGVELFEQLRESG